MKGILNGRSILFCLNSGSASLAISAKSESLEMSTLKASAVSFTRVNPCQEVKRASAMQVSALKFRQCLVMSLM